MNIEFESAKYKESVKYIEFVKYISLLEQLASKNIVKDARSRPKDFDNVILISKSSNFDVMLAISGNDKMIYLGFWNDGIIKRI